MLKIHSVFSIQYATTFMVYLNFGDFIEQTLLSASKYKTLFQV